jgi:hypothetical protein
LLVLETVVLNGARAQDIKVDEVCEILVSNLKHLDPNKVYKLRDIEIADCMGCFCCWIKTPGECVIDDKARNIAAKLLRSDLTVFVSPIVFGGYSYELKKMLDRQICRELPFFKLINGEIHHQPRYERHPNLVAIGVLPQPNAEAEAIFKALVSRNAINMHAPSYATGIVYGTDSAEVIAEKIKHLLIEVGAQK